MRRFLFLFFCLAALADVKLIAGNTEQADSLIHSLSALKGRARIAVLNSAAGLMMHDRPDSASLLAREALELSRNFSDLEGQANATAYLGSIAYLNGDIDSALFYHRGALNIRLMLDDKKAIADSYNDLGALHDRAMREDSALIYYQKALYIFEELKDLTGISQSFNNIGVFYWRTKNYGEAVKMFLKSEKIDLELENDNGLGYTYSNLGACYSEMRDHQKSLEYHRKALDIRQKLGNQLQIGRSLNNIASSYLGLGDFTNASKFYQESLEIKRHLGHGWEVLETLNNLSEVYIKTNKISEALILSEEALFLADSLHSPAQKVTTLANLATIYAEKGDFKSAFRIQKTRISLHDSLVTAERNHQTAEMQAKFEGERKQMEIEQLNLDKEKAEIEVEKVRSRNSLLVAVIVIVIAIAGFFFALSSLRARSNRELSRLNHELEDSNHQIAAKNEEIERQKALLETQNHQILDINSKLERLVEERTADLRRANDELDTFLYQSSHAMRAPVLRLQGLFELSEKENDQETQEEVSRSILITLNRIDGMLRKLNQVSGLARREVRPAPIDLQHTVEEAMEQISYLKPGEKPDILTRFSGIGSLSTDPGILKIILTNLLENAYHFRKTDQSQAVVELELKSFKDHNELIFKDFGSGISPIIQNRVFGMFFRGTEASKGEGLGLYVVKKASERLNATLSLRIQEKEYTEFTFSFPVQPELH